MSLSEPITTVSIRPDVSVLTVLRHLNYKPWYAIAEFVDNSLESFLRHRKEIVMVDGDAVKLRVEIVIDSSNSGTITVRDNAAGIYANEYERAFRPAVPPPKVDGLSEFGMGMKSAAMWFGRRFMVRSCALGESVERIVVFDIDDIVRSKSDRVPISEISAKRNHHYTEVMLSNLRQVPYGKTMGKIKDHLASIYRAFIREGTLEIRFHSAGVDEILSYEEPRILFAPPADVLIRRHGLSPKALPWRKDIQLELGDGLKVSGFAAIREEGSTAKAGFALFRRNRLIEGSGEESYRPEIIFGASTTAVYQRLFGEFQLEGFDVSHTKDGFRWGENEDLMLDSMRAHLNAIPIPLIDQAREAKYKTLQNMNRAKLDNVVTDAVTDTTDVLKETATPVVDAQIHNTSEILPPPTTLPAAQQSWHESFNVELHGITWSIVVEVTNDPGISEWIRVFDNGTENRIRILGVSMSLSHPFMERFVGPDVDRVKPFVRLAAAIGLAEITAREAGVRQVGEMRRNINQLLKEALSDS